MSGRKTVPAAGLKRVASSQRFVERVALHCERSMDVEDFDDAWLVVEGRDAREAS